MRITLLLVLWLMTLGWQTAFADEDTDWYSVMVCLQRQQEEGRFFIAKDMNCDGAFTVSDIWPLIEWVFFLPGDLLVLTLMAGGLRLQPFSNSRQKV